MSPFPSLCKKRKLARLQRALLGVGAGNAASFDRRIADAIPEPEGFPPGGQQVGVLAIDRLDPSHSRVGLAGALEQVVTP